MNMQTTTEVKETPDTKLAVYSLLDAGVPDHTIMTALGVSQPTVSGHRSKRIIERETAEKARAKRRALYAKHYSSLGWADRKPVNRKAARLNAIEVTIARERSAPLGSYKT